MFSACILWPCDFILCCFQGKNSCLIKSGIITLASAIVRCRFREVDLKLCNFLKINPFFGSKGVCSKIVSLVATLMFFFLCCRHLPL